MAQKANVFKIGTHAKQTSHGHQMSPLYIHKIHGLNIKIREYSESPVVPPNFTFWRGRQVVTEHMMQLGEQMSKGNM